MPLSCAAIATQDQAYPCHTSGSRITRRAASVPVAQSGDSRLESLRSKKQKTSLSDVKDIVSSGSPSPVTARGRKHDSLSCAADCVASTSISVAEQYTDTGERHPQKRRKRSSSTPAAPRLSQFSSQQPSRRRSRSRVGSPTVNMEYVPRSRASSRRLRRIHPLLDSHIPDIYMHLAGPDGAGNLLNEPPAGSAIISTPNELVGSQSLKRTMGRRRKMADLTDESEKKELIEEWARMRQSQNALPSSGINGIVRSSQTLLHANQRSGRFVQLHRRSPPDAGLTKYQTTIVDVSQSQETALDDSLRGSISPRTDFEDAMPVDTDSSGKKLDHKDLALPPDGTGQAIVPDSCTESLSTGIPDSNMDEDSHTGKPAGNPDHPVVQCPGFWSPSFPASLSRKDFVHNEHTCLAELPINEQVEALCVSNLSKDNHSVTLPQTYSVDAGGIYLDSDEEFYMLELQEVFTLPWAPVSSHLYVPPSLGKLISGKQLFIPSGIDFIRRIRQGMKGQLMIEARARRRAEGLYQEELNRRISAEKIVEELQEELEEKNTRTSPES